jgi:pimeloyl-ACP methyl ester carboxylesterase
VLWGELDELLPVARSAAWAAHGLPVEVVAGGGHLLEWDEPGGVGGRLVEFLADSRGGG